MAQPRHHLGAVRAHGALRVLVFTWLFYICVGVSVVAALMDRATDKRSRA
jgi:hypothetical protein